MTIGLVALCLIATAGSGLAIGHPSDEHFGRACHEDEAAFWAERADGSQGHIKCIALDDLVLHPRYFHDVADGICDAPRRAERWYGVTRMPEGCDR